MQWRGRQWRLARALAAAASASGRQAIRTAGRQPGAWHPQRRCARLRGHLRQWPRLPLRRPRRGRTQHRAERRSHGIRPRSGSDFLVEATSVATGLTGRACRNRWPKIKRRRHHLPHRDSHAHFDAYSSPAASATPSARGCRTAHMLSIRFGYGRPLSSARCRAAAFCAGDNGCARWPRGLGFFQGGVLEAGMGMAAGKGGAHRDAMRCANE